MENYDCCPFKTTPGKIFGGWASCIHGLHGRRNELLREIEKIENQIILLGGKRPDGKSLQQASRSEPD